MTDLTPVAAERRLMEISRLLDAGADALSALDEQYVRVKQEYEVAFARAPLRAEGPNADARKATATLAVADQRLAMEIAEQKVRAAKERQSVLRTQAEIGRSLYSGLKTNWGTT